MKSPNTESGATAISALLWWGVCTAVAAVMLTAVLQVGLASVRAQQAADAGALAAAGATLLGPTPGDPRAAAQTAAHLHGAELEACCGQLNIIPPRIRVTVGMRLAMPAALVRAYVLRHASASLRPHPQP